MFINLTHFFFDFKDTSTGQMLTSLPFSGYELVWGTRKLDLM